MYVYKYIYLHPLLDLTIKFVWQLKHRKTYTPMLEDLSVQKMPVGVVCRNVTGLAVSRKRQHGEAVKMQGAGKELPQSYRS